jgi:putative hydrolase of the HAD superfamily
MSLSLDSVRFVLFDAVGTLIYPNPGAAEAYSAAGEEMGIHLPRDEIAARFRAALKMHTQDGDRPTNEDRERERWRKIVSDVFRAGETTNEALFQVLWRNFGDPKHWEMYDDVAPAWRLCQGRGLTIGIASNFDSRLVGVLRALGDFGDPSRWFYSSLVGYSKPNGAYFAAVADLLNASPAEILLVGDDYRNDYLAARTAGWKTIWLERTAARPEIIADGERIVSLRDLEKLFRSHKEGHRGDC